jgi:hypothetical protein
MAYPLAAPGPASSGTASLVVTSDNDRRPPRPAFSANRDFRQIRIKFEMIEFDAYLNRSLTELFTEK